MKIRIPLMIQDPLTARKGPVKPTEGFDADREGFFLDGPITDRIAVLDFEPETGRLAQAARFHGPSSGRVRGWYEDQQGVDLNKVTQELKFYTPEFMQVSVFATVLKTMYLFERTDTLGRPLTWAFDAPQLLVVPRAGKQANAYYHRDSHSLQFFYFDSPIDQGQSIYTCLSRDIVAHETGHAIIDGLAPDLIDASSPQSLAIHEAIADLTALLMAFDSGTLRKAVLARTKGSIEKTTEFSSIAEQFGEARGFRGGLRLLANDKNLDPADRQNGTPRDEPHELSQVLSGALFSVMIRIHDDLKVELSALPQYAGKADPLFSASGLALSKGAERFKRMVFRALDYLPPGEVSFADYGRAILAVDQVAFPDNDKMRQWIRAEFVRRSIVPSEAALDMPTRDDTETLPGIDVPTLQASDWAAYQFANAHRQLLRIPADIPFVVRPRLDVKKQYDYHTVARECIFKVAWELTEPNSIGARYPGTRRVTVGTTLALDWETGRLLGLLTSAPVDPAKGGPKGIAIEEYELGRQDRDWFLMRLINGGLLRIGRQAIGPGGEPFREAIQAQDLGGVLHLRGTANSLHMVGQP